MLGFILLGTTLTLAGGAGTEFRQPQAGVLGNRVAVTFGSGKTIHLVASVDGGKTFGQPRRVAEVPFLALGRHRGPRVALTPRAIVVTAIAGEKGGGQDGDLLAWRSMDGGHTWTGPVPVNDTPASAREGLHAMVSDSRGTIYAVWLDLRDKGTKLYGSTSTDSGATWTANRVLYESPSGTICECCHPSLAAGPGGVIAMFRNSADGNRDMYIVPFIGGGKATKAGTGTWPLNACPMDGGAVSIDMAGKPIAAFRREKDILLAREPAGEETVGGGKDPALAVTRNAIYVAWTGPDGMLLWKSSELGVTNTVDTAGAYAHLVALAGGNGALLVWEAKGLIQSQLLN